MSNIFSNKAKMFFTVTILTILVSSNYIHSQNYWYELKSPTTNFLRSVQFTDSLTGWVVGDSGLVLHTSNGGDDWITQQTNINDKIVDIFFLDENKGWAVAWREGAFPVGTTILSTTDGGEDWSLKEYPEDNVFMASIYFLDSLNGFLGGFPGEFKRTTNGGLDWIDVSIDTVTFAFFPPTNFNFYNELYGFACGGVIDIAGVVWKTTNGGEFWTPIDTAYAPPDQVWDVHYFDSLNVLCAGGDPELFGVGFLRSSDAGSSWEFDEIGFFGVARALGFRTEYEGWAPVPGSEALLITTDYGESWRDFPSPGSSQIYDLVFTDSLHGYAVGFEGTILKYEYPLVNSNLDRTNNLIPDFELFQNYPNPFNPATTISYSLREESSVTFEIFNVRGERIYSNFVGTKSKGSNIIRYNASDLSSGIYFYRLIVQELNGQKRFLTDVGKMILLK